MMYSLSILTSTFKTVRTFLVVCVVMMVSTMFGTFSSGCNESPSAVGSVLAPDTISTRSVSSADTSILLSDSSLLQRSVYYNSGALFIGRTPTMSAATFLRFVNIPDTLASINPTDIDSTALAITPTRYVIGDSSANILSMSIYRVQKQWLVSDSDGNVKVEPRWNNLFPNGIASPSADYFDPTPISDQTTLNIPLADTLREVRIRLNQQANKMVSDWFKWQPDTELRKGIWGLAFIPNQTSTVIRQFFTRASGSSTAPLVRLFVYFKRNGIRDSFELLSGNDVTVVDAPQGPSNLLQMQSLVQYESRINFDVSFIPSLESVQNARLILTADTTKTTGGNFGLPTSIVAVYVDTISNILVPYQAIRKPGSDKYIFNNVGSGIDAARKFRSGKGYFAIRSSGIGLEAQFIHRLDDPDKSKRPVLTITYSSRPKFGGK
jgi:hypothetical protein